MNPTETSGDPESLGQGDEALSGSELLSLAEVVPAPQGAAASSWLSALTRAVAGRPAQVGLAFVNDQTMTTYNHQYRGLAQPTDVLSFPAGGETEAVDIGARALIEDDGTESASDGSGEHLGDVLISIETAKRQAEEDGNPLTWELQCLILHGVLHCLGFDHENDDGEMDAIELDLRDRWIDETSPWSCPVAAEQATETPVSQTRVAGDTSTARETLAKVDGAKKFGQVAIVGRPNAGKSTLMNEWLGEKLSIVSTNPQTTRHRIVGILSEARGQMVFLDTPGIHKAQHRLNRRMVKTASDALAEADLVALIVDVSVKAGSGDQFVRDFVATFECPKIALLNKVDLIKKGPLLPLIQEYVDAGFDPVIPISALEADGTATALEVLWNLLPAGEPVHDPELLTLLSERFLVAERIREKILERTRDELPFVVAVLIEDWQGRPDGTLYLAASILVERPGQKKILIGKGGQQIKAVGIAAREDLEEFLGHPVFLDLRVKEQRNWREDPRLIAQLENYELA